MKIEKGKYYFIRVNVYGRELEYRGRVSEIVGGSFRLNTDADCGCRAPEFRLKDVLFFEEVEEGKSEGVGEGKKLVRGELKIEKGPLD